MFATLFVKKRITHKVLAKQFVHKTLRAVDETFERNYGFGFTLGRVAKGSDNKQPMSLSVSDKTCV